MSEAAVETVVRVERVEKVYVMGATRLHVLHDVSLEVGRGERVAVVGPSGAGKSTLLHLIGGLDKPTGGVVRFKGRDLYQMPASERTAVRARHMGFVFQSYHLLPELDVVENVLLPVMALEGRRRALSAHRDQATAVLTDVGLGGRLRHTPMELSGGEQQRVALARALVNEPELVLADEPTGNLDSATGEQVLQALFRLTGERRQTVVLVTHNADLAARCDRVVRLRDGRVESGGTNP
jgi:predicted ABC-type transport system involved in lysophospholipase L1 biosynthesis ATPase subunit